MLRLMYCDTCDDHVYHDREGVSPRELSEGHRVAWLCRRCMGLPEPQPGRRDERAEAEAKLWGRDR